MASPMNPNLSLDALIAQKVGELTIMNAKQAILIETLKLEVMKRDAEIARLKAAEPELDLQRAASSEIEAANGKAH